MLANSIFIFLFIRLLLWTRLWSNDRYIFLKLGDWADVGLNCKFKKIHFKLLTVATFLNPTWQKCFRDSIENHSIMYKFSIREVIKRRVLQCSMTYDTPNKIIAIFSFRFFKNYLDYLWYMLFCGIIYLMAWFPIRINGCFNQNAIFREIHQVVIIQQSFLCQQRTRRGYWLNFLLAIQFVLLQSLTSKYWDPKFPWIDKIHA